MNDLIKATYNKYKNNDKLLLLKNMLIELKEKGINISRECLKTRIKEYQALK